MVEAARRPSLRDPVECHMRRMPSGHAAVSSVDLAEARTVHRSNGWDHGSCEYRELAAVGAYWSGKDGQRCEAHSDHVACSGGTGGI